MTSTQVPSPLPIITIIGSLNADLVTYTSRIPRGGETLQANSFNTGSGGKGGNQAAACARLSRPRGQLSKGTAAIRMVGAVGHDLYGETLRRDLAASGVETSDIAIKKDVTTGVAIIIVEEASGENRILLDAGANHSMAPTDFATLPRPTPALVILQLEIRLDATLGILAAARREHVEVLLNPAPAVVLPDEAYDGLAHLILNESEAVILAGCTDAQIQDDGYLPVVGRTFHGRGVANVVITLGARGAFYSGAAGAAGLVRAMKVAVVDTTAAGDTFVGAYALEVVRPGFDLKTAVEKANRASAVTVGRKGAQESIPWADELDG